MNPNTHAAPVPPAVPVNRLPRLPLGVCVAGVALMLAAAAAAWLATPRLQAMQGAPSLDATVPKAFGDWRVVQDATPQVDVSQGVETVQEQPYDQTVMRTYANSKGEQIMLALAWGERQRQDVKVHRPEVCYPAQGYAVRKLSDAPPIGTAGRAAPVPTTEILAESRGGGYEAVRYWIRIGEMYGGDGMAARWYILNEGFRGRIPDGMLVRASQRLPQPGDEARSQALMASFLAELVAAAPAPARAMLVR
ncbi:exosortase C-terminal domain/associated protein EpsI [Mitsuaria sp. GD03876]|uniref:exosortase C-terminal domain/associated protein EpsI n=1 Tax=Mitsuaria sp. GD03876 TaxID=2975399 RepID=UPI00244A6935|nr:exosortase C-terminal domain/associated protein EpsI [Mitsuaria sp. GD03876]MDH0863436.1 EpsI family protein [Mitsuaria sp. GD03876]